MDKNKIISQTIIFMIVVGFVVVFKTIFGEDNTLVGVTTITAILMFSKRDLTIAPFKNLFKLVGINLLMGVGSVIASDNMYIGIFINFGIIFLIHYIYNYTLLNPMYLPFALQYLFILSYPVEGQGISIRLVALAVGAILIMLTQLIINRKKITTNGNKIALKMCDLIIEGLETNENKDNLEEEVKNLNNELKKIIYEKRESNYYLSDEGRNKLALATVLERINIIINETTNEEISSDVLDDLYFLIDSIRRTIKNENTKIDLNKMLEKYENKSNLDILELRLLENMIILIEVIDELNKIKTYNKCSIGKKAGYVPRRYKEEISAYFNLKKRTMKLTYALRISMGISLAAFAVDYFNWTEGRWMLFTIVSLVNPIYEVTKDKTIDRIVGTMIGAIIVTILYGFIENTSIRTVILMLAGYVGGYTKSYRQNMVFITIAAIGSAALIDDVSILSVNRILFVMLGATISVLLNQYVYPYKLEDANNDLGEIYIDTIKNMIREIALLSKNKTESNDMKNLLIRSSLVQERLSVNNQMVKEDNYIIQERRFLALDIYGLYLFLSNVDIDNLKVGESLESILEIKKYKCRDVQIKEEEIIEQIKVEKDLKSKIALSSIYCILHDLNEIA